MTVADPLPPDNLEYVKVHTLSLFTSNLKTSSKILKMSVADLLPSDNLEYTKVHTLHLIQLVAVAVLLSLV